MVLSTSWSIPVLGNATRESSIVLIGKNFFTDFLLPFELASVFLLMAMVGAIILARRDVLPDEIPTNIAQTPVLSLPERPRELVSSIPEDSTQKG